MSEVPLSERGSHRDHTFRTTQSRILGADRGVRRTVQDRAGGKGGGGSRV